MSQVITLKEYAERNNVTYEAVRQQVVRYADELGEHLIKDGRQQFLDEEAVDFLDSKRQKNPVTIIQANKDEEIERLKRENENLLKQIALKSEKIEKLSEWKAEMAVEIAKIDQNKALLEDKQKQIEEKEQLYLDAKKESQEKDEQIKLLQDEVDSFGNPILGFYRKKKEK